MSSMMPLLVGLWAHVGPGLLLVLALPLALAAFGAIIAEGLRRRSARSATSG
jgi:hypothetical protein